MRKLEVNGVTWRSELALQSRGSWSYYSACILWTSVALAFISGQFSLKESTCQCWRHCCLSQVEGWAAGTWRVQSGLLCHIWQGGLHSGGFFRPKKLLGCNSEQNYPVCTEYHNSHMLFILLLVCALPVKEGNRIQRNKNTIYDFPWLFLMCYLWTHSEIRKQSFISLMK